MKNRNQDGVPPLCIICTGRHPERLCPTAVMARDPTWKNKPGHMEVVCGSKWPSGPYRGKYCGGKGHSTEHPTAIFLKA